MISKFRPTYVCVIFLLVCSPLRVNAQETGAAAETTVSAAAVNWKDTIEWSGDVRLRYETIDEDGREDRNRSRIRARLGFELQATDTVDFAIRVATSEGSPVSTNITFDDGFSGKQIVLDRAFATWHAMSGLDLLGGKMKSPWFRAGGNSMHFDSDLNPEGAAAIYKSDGGLFFGSLGAFSVDERSSGDDSLLMTVQGGLKFDTGDRSQLTVAAGYFDYTNTVGNTPFYLSREKGNSVDAAGNFIYDYDIFEVAAEFKFNFGDLPLTAFAVVAQNSEAPVEDTAYAFGIKIADLTSRDNLQFSYAYHSTEADSVIGIFTDSDFAGGDTDSNGHFIKAKYFIRKNIELGGTLIISERGEFAGNKTDYNRLQLDVEFLFK